MDTLVKHPPPIHLGIASLQLMMDDWDAPDSDELYSKAELQAAVDASADARPDDRKRFWQKILAYVYEGETAEVQASNWQRGPFSRKGRTTQKLPLRKRYAEGTHRKLHPKRPRL